MLNWKKMVSMLLVVMMTLSSAGPAFAVRRDAAEAGAVVVRDSSGQPVDTGNWEEVFPYGTFVVGESQVTLVEKGQDNERQHRVQIYRLGGTQGKATAYLQMSPAVSMTDENTPNYTNAAGKSDYTVQVEDPMPIAAYQPVGRPADPLASGAQIIVDEGRATETVYGEEGEVIEYGSIPLVADVTADSWQWHIYSAETGQWSAVSGATDKEMVIGLDRVDGHNYRCVYTVDGVEYSTDGLSGYQYAPYSEELTPAPPDLELNPSQTFSRVSMEDGEFDTYTFPLTFAQGEWVKEVIFTVEEDVEDEADEFATLTITGCEGGTVYDAQNTMALRIVANGNAGATYLAFNPTEYEADKSSYYAILTIQRTGSLLDFVSVSYTTRDGTAVGGIDYDHVAANARIAGGPEEEGAAPASGMPEGQEGPAGAENSNEREGIIFFAPGVAGMTLKIPLINDQVVDEVMDKTFSVELTGIKGAAEGSSITAAVAAVRLGNSNSAEGMNASTLLSTGNVLDLSAAVGETIRAIAQKPKTPEVVPVRAEAREQAYADVSFGLSAAAEAAGIVTPLAYDYGSVTLNRGSIPDYNSRFWVGNAWFANSTGKYNNYEVNNVEGLMDSRNWYNASNTPVWPRNLDYSRDLYRYKGRNYQDWSIWTLSQCDYRVELPYFAEEFSQAKVNAFLEVEHGTWWFSEKASASGIKMFSAGQAWGYEQISGLLYRNGMGGSSKGMHETTWATGETSRGFEMFIERLGSDGGDTVGRAEIHDAILARRVMGGLYLAVHTADEEAINASNSAAAIWNAIKPAISPVEGQGGVDSSGRFYVGSMLNVTPAASSTYRLATPGNQSSVYGLYLAGGRSKSYGDAVNHADSLSAGSSSIRMVTESDSNRLKTNTTYTMNVVMDRVQSIQLNVAPSGGADKGRALFQGRSKGVKSTAAAFTWVSGGEPKFTDSTANISLSGSGSVLSMNNLRNLKKINFGLPEEDIILFNGRSYKGNADINIPSGMFNMAALTFIYYNKDYQQNITDMDLSVSHVEQYIDANGNGKLDGYFDAGAGAFILTDKNDIAQADPGFDPASADILVNRLEPEDYAITNFEPVYMKINGSWKYVEQFFKMYYSMTPRALSVPAGASASDRAQVLPVFTTNITNEANLSKLTRELRGYRFIESGIYGMTYALIDDGDNWKTVVVPENETPPAGAVTVKKEGEYSGDGKLMYQAAASMTETVDIPLGGNTNPIDLAWNAAENKPRLDGKGRPYYDPEDWDPRYINHLIYQFDDPEPIFINNTPLGDFVPVAGKTGAGGALTSQGYNKAQLNAYLGSFNPNETVLLGVQEQKGSTDEIKTLEDQQPESLPMGLNTSNATGIGSMPGTDNLRTMRAMDDKSSSTAGADTGKSDNSWSEMNIDSGVELPNLEIGISDYITVIMDGNEVGFSIGIPLFKAESSTKNYTRYDDENGPKKFRSETSGPVSENAEAMGNIKDAFTNPAKLLQDDTIKDAMIAKRGAVQGERSIRSQSASVEIGFNVTILFKYSPLDNKYMFSQAMVAVTAGLEFKYTLRLTACPIVYAYFVIGFELEAVGGVLVDRVVRLHSGSEAVLNFGRDQSAWAAIPDGKWSVDTTETGAYKGDLLVGEKGAEISVEVKSDTFQITFSGKLGVKDGGTAPGQAGFGGFSGGFITSDGSEPFVVKTGASVTGTGSGWITLVVLEDGTSIDKLELIKEITSDTYFSGLTISPELFLEVGAGIGVDVLKVEVYFKASIGCTMTFARRVPDEKNGGYKTEAFSFDAMKFRAGLGIRVVLLLFNFEMDMIQFGIDYRKEANREIPGNDDQFSAEGFNEDGWKFAWYFFNGMSDLSLQSAEGGLPGVRIGLPRNGYMEQAVFGPDSGNVVDNAAAHAGGLSPMAIDPYTNAPFQISGYASDGSAFKLADGLETGADYQLVTAGGKNYLFYTVSRQQESGESSVDANMLVMSEVVSTGDADKLGLVKPGTTDAGYIIVDMGKEGAPAAEDRTGDLDFSASAAKDGKSIEVVWVSYEKPYNQYTDAATTGALEIQAYAAQHTVVKRSKIDLKDADSVAAGFSPAQVVSPDNNNDGSRFAPKVLADTGLIFHVSSTLMSEAEANSANVRHQAEYDATKPTTPSAVQGSSGDPSAGFRLTYNQAMDKVYGQNSVLNFAVWDEAAAEGAGAYKQYTALPDQANWAAQGMRIDNVTMGTLPAVSGADTGTEQAFYLAYTASKTAMSTDSSNKTATARFLYLQKGAISTSGGGITLTLGKATVVRKLYDAPDGAAAESFGLSLKDIVEGQADYKGMDGVYAGTQQKTAFQDPYFGNLKFLTGKLGALNGTAENFDETLGYDLSPLGTAEPELFLLFEMNGNTYVIPQTDLGTITDDTAGTPENPVRSGRVIPFFEGSAGSTRGNVVIGADSQGNISAVYTDTVPNSTNNAVYMMQYYPGDTEKNIEPSWGDGRMLAMNAMQAYENAAAAGWSQADTQAAYLDEARGGNMNSFVFSNLEVAVGQDIPDGSGSGAPPRPSLLIIAQGVQTELEKAAFAGKDDFTYTNIDGSPADDSEVIVPKTTTGGAILSRTGFYALSFGSGQQDIGEGRISFDRSVFVPGAELSPVISFKNTGDVPIRGSKDQPVTLKLWIRSPATAASFEDKELAEWKITGSIPVGVTISTYSETIGPKTATLPAGDPVKGLEGYQFYFTLSEDKTYFTNPFEYDSSADQNGGAVVTVEKRPELAIENASVRLAGLREGKPAVSVDLAATNRGAENANGVYIQFSYQSGVDAQSGAPVYTPVDLTGHQLSVGEPIKLEELSTLSASTNEELQQGILRLHGPDGYDNLNAGYARLVTGSFTVPKKAFYTEAGAAGLNLRMEIHSAADAGDKNRTVENSGLILSSHDGELDGHNNIVITHMKAETYFALPSSFVLPLGTTTRLYAGAESTREVTPVITVEELSTDLSKPEIRHLGILYHEAAGDYLMISPSTAGQGVVRVSDTTTGRFADVPFTVSEAGEGVNIFNDNGIFTFYDTTGAAYTANTTGSHKDDWIFRDKQLTWGSGSSAAAPGRYDLAEAKRGTKLSFTTMAKSIDLYFQGTVTVESTFAGFSTRRNVTCAGGTNKVTVDFGNEGNTAHTVTITVTSDTALLDRFTESYGQEGPPTPADDKHGPQIYWSRSMPETAELKAGETPKLTVYVIDDSGLAGVTLDGKAVNTGGAANFKALSDTLWQFEVTRTDNTNIQVKATDTSGNVTNRTVVVDWFSVSGGGTTDSALKLDARLVDENGGLIPDSGYLSGKARIAFEPAETGETVSVQIWNQEKVMFQESGIAPDEDGYLPISVNGVYRIVKQTSDGKFAAAILWMNRYDPSNPAIKLSYSPESGQLTYQVAKMKDEYTPLDNGAKDVAPIGEVRMNGVLISVPAGLVNIIQTYDVEFNGKYQFEAYDTSSPRKTAIPAEQRVTDRNVKFALSPDRGAGDEAMPPWGAAGGYRAGTTGVIVSHAWDQAGTTGFVKVDSATVKGGYYDENVLEQAVSDSSGAAGIYTGRYRFALVPQGQTPEDDDFTAATFTAADGVYTFDNLAAGVYTLYAKDAIETVPEGGQPNMAALDVTVEDRSIRLTETGGLSVTNTLKESSAGSIAVQAEGGISGDLLFGIYRVEDPRADLNDLVWFDPEASITDWLPGTPDAEKAGVYSRLFGKLSIGDYIIVVRDADDSIYGDPGIEGVTLVLHARVEERKPDPVPVSGGGSVPDSGYTADIYGLKVKTTSGQKPVTDKDGNITLPGGGTIETESGMVIKAPAGTKIAKDGTVTIPRGKKGEISLPGGARIDVPGVATITADGRIALPSGASGLAKLQDGISLRIRPGTVIIPDKNAPLGYYVECDNPFTDISKDDPSYNDIMFAYTHGLFNGTGDTKFSPRMSMTRGMIVTVLGRLLDIETARYSGSTFSDVKDGAYYAPYVEWARKMGIVNGVGNNRFNPDAPISNQDLAVILSNFARLLGKTLPAGQEAGSSHEDPDVADYAKKAVEELLKAGIIGRLDNEFVPKDHATRAEVAAALHRFTGSE